MDCVDLRELARAKRWRWRFEGSYSAERDPEVRGDGRWYVELVCHSGLIYTYGGDELLAYARTTMLNKLLSLDPAVRVHQGGDRDAVVRFPVALLEKVASVLKPRRRKPGRNLTSEEAKRMVESKLHRARSAARSAAPAEDGS